MHGVLLGITKLLMILWISPSFPKEKCSVSGAVDLIDERLTCINPSPFITRIPRTLSNYFKYWKDYLLHYASFVEAVVLLCTDSIADEDIARSERLLSYFVYMCPHLYSDRYITLNMHSLLHIPQCVKDLGPLWLFHGTHNVKMQILGGINVIQNLSTLTDQITDSKVLDFILKLKATNNYKKLSHATDSGTSSGFYLLGKGTHKYMSDETYVKLVKENNCKPTQILHYQRIMLRGCVLHSESYARVHARNSYTVKYFCLKNSKLQFGIIVNFLYVKKCDCLQDVCNCDNCIIAVMKLFECSGSIMNENFLNIKVPSISVCKLSNQTDVTDVSKIIEVQVNVNFKEESQLYFLCDVPNVKECD
ncbi:hypothetical protein MAR_004993 [Mya arenaria]|uniref:Uncharacterized protein n=1 Tax=Mya arenaria TaxID=6604 RepID=A0ABY7F2B8_MYAAR|nr:hypothetical protein MAR_004993 [Mya arenaria]